MSIEFNSQPCIQTREASDAMDPIRVPAHHNKDQQKVVRCTNKSVVVELTADDCLIRTSR
jgi:hypothetical protein